MDNLLVCSGVIDNRDIVNCPLRFDCIRFTTRPVNINQSFIKPECYHVDHNFVCENYLKEIKCCGNWNEYGECKCNL